MMHVPERSRDSLPTHDIVVIGASAGGVEAISTLVSDLPRDLRAARSSWCSTCPRGGACCLRFSPARDVFPLFNRKTATRSSTDEIYVARPDQHLVVEPGRMRVVHGPTENGCRPAVDPLFRSAARVYGPRVVGIVLTGGFDDGTAGLAAVKEAGGIAIVQDPDEAFAPSMPRSARAFVQVDHVLPVREIAVLIAELTREQTNTKPPAKGLTSNRSSPTWPSRASRCRKAIGRGRSRSSLAPSAMARCGKPTSAASSGFAAASDMRIQRRACSRRRPTRSIVRCGRRSDHLRSGRR